ncbi:uncharacterized protein BJ171DRAFT_31516 [Polychytrium aggregatum]|uniref:uncharacterized protein n=1 Tax=Polychytrium aggregatum TaxID=110093 RepID=UPI0022FEFA9C|nr:uncharacterized protein BJ171DRAFT_31516 [Polychytrium aggregatum]KAI9206489.1 hypothetical protein BJ171DRAFT_31516 [Polychytrium aggregatum]
MPGSQPPQAIVRKCLPDTEHRLLRCAWMVSPRWPAEPNYICLGSESGPAAQRRAMCCDAVEYSAAGAIRDGRTIQTLLSCPAHARPHDGPVGSLPPCSSARKPSTLGCYCRLQPDNWPRHAGCRLAHGGYMTASAPGPPSIGRHRSPPLHRLPSCSLVCGPTAVRSSRRFSAPCALWSGLCAACLLRGWPALNRNPVGSRLVMAGICFGACIPPRRPSTASTTGLIRQHKPEAVSAVTAS